MPFQNPSAASAALGSHKVYLFFLVLDFLLDVFCWLRGLILNVISILLEEMFGFCEVQFQTLSLRGCYTRAPYGPWYIIPKGPEFLRYVTDLV